VTALDTSGARILEKSTRVKPAAWQPVALWHPCRGLLAQTHELNRAPPDIDPRKAWPQVQIERAADVMASVSRDVLAFLRLLGAVSIRLGRIMPRPARLRLSSTVYRSRSVRWIRPVQRSPSTMPSSRLRAIWSGGRAEIVAGASRRTGIL